jgi:hypothetical protein
MKCINIGAELSGLMSSNLHTLGTLSRLYEAGAIDSYIPWIEISSSSERIVEKSESGLIPAQMRSSDTKCMAFSSKIWPILSGKSYFG